MTNNSMRLALRSDFDFHVDISQPDGIPVIVIEDQDMGRMSVTNNIENIVDYVLWTLKGTSRSQLWIYRDSEGVYDGYDPKIGFIYPLGKRDEAEAVAAARRRAG